MNRAWRRYTAKLIAPIIGLVLLFWAIRDGFILRTVTFRSDGEVTTYTGKDAILIGLALLLGAALCAFISYRFWVVDPPVDVE